MKGKFGLFLLFVVMFAIARLPGVLSDKLGSFSGTYALVFCAGVYLRGRHDWLLPFGALVISDIALNAFYRDAGWQVWNPEVLRYQLFTYAAYAGIFLLGRSFKPKSSFLSLLGGGILGAVLFYIFTNIASWLFNPFQNHEYTRDLLGLLIALTKGAGNWPDAWQFFRNTFLSGGLFTALLVAAMKATTVAESAEEKKAPEPVAEPASEPEPEEAKA